MISRVLIVGGGIAGTTTAIALAQDGIACTIAELQSEWQATGVGIGLQSPPLRATKALGLFDRIVAIARQHPEIVVADAGGRQLGAMPQVNVNDPEDPPFVNLSRMALHSILVRAVRECGATVRLGTTVNSLDEDGDRVRATMSDGSVEDYGLVIGADGLHSRVRDLALPEAPQPAYAGQVIWRMGGRCPGGLDRYTIMVAGPTRIGLVPLPDDELYLWMLDSTLPPERPPRDQLLPLFQQRMGAYGGFAPAVAAQAVSSDQLDFRALHAVLVPPPWHTDRVVLIGDAVHTTTPHLAYGAGLAIEDAVVLGQLAGSGVGAGDIGRRLTERRFERCRMVVENSLQLSRWEQQGGPPNPEAPKLSAATFAKLAERF